MNKIRIHFTNIDSTNTWAKQHINELDPHSLTVITADEQNGGRGQFNRKWVSPPGLNIYATFCYLLKAPVKDAGPLSQLLSRAAVCALQELGFSPKLKWPNDILLSGKKVAGVLCELVTEDNGQWVIAGIGLNVNMSKDLLEKIDQPATSLCLEGGLEIDRDLLLQKIVHAFELFLR